MDILQIIGLVFLKTNIKKAFLNDDIQDTVKGNIACKR
jgi:hypothetical protein